MNNFKKIDLLLTLLIGEVVAWLMIMISKNLAVENPAIAGAASYLNYLPVIFPILCGAGLIVAHILSKIIPLIYQLAKFVLVGGMNFLIDMAVLNFFVFYTGISAGLVQSGFKGISFCVAVINSYLWNKFWTFKRITQETAAKEFLQFLIVSIIGFSVNVGVDYVVINMFTPFAGILDKTWAQIGALIAAVIALVWNFLGYKFIVFDVKKEVTRNP